MRKDHVGSGLGTVSLVPERSAIVVGRRFWVDITYTTGSKGVGVGGAVRFRLPGLVLNNDTKGPVSCSNPDVRWACSNHLPEINGKSGSEFFVINYLFILILEGSLREGDSITVRYGANLARKTAAPQCAMEWPVEVAVDTDGSRTAPGSGFYLVENPPVLTFISDKPHRIEVFVPSYTRVNESFRITVRMLDRYNNIVEDYTGTVFLDVQTDEECVFLGKHTFEPYHKGVLVVESIQFKTTGVHRIVARDEALGIYARSNPTWTTMEISKVALYWGDTHCHSSISADTAANNAMIRRPAGNYDYARNRSALDFCMVTDHIENHSEEDWQETREAARDANEPGKFVTFSGFEATYRPLRSEGDKNVYFFNDDEAWVNQGTTEELYDNLKQRKSRTLVIPHLHVPTNWDRHDPELERVVEIYAHWGCGLSQESDPPLIPGTPRKPESYVHHALEQGARLGFIASADHSLGHPGDDFWWPLSNHNGGLAAVYAPELTREGIWQGLWNRNCYATTRARIILAFEINGHSMGEEYADSTPGRELMIRVNGTTAISEINIVKNGRVVQTYPGNRELDIELNHRDDAVECDTDYYYVHVRQEDGEQAWSSPVWVTHQA